MTATPEPARLAEIRASHTRSEFGDCLSCGHSRWPCDTAITLTEIDRLAALRASDDGAYQHVAEMCNQQLVDIRELEERASILEAEVERLRVAALPVDPPARTFDEWVDAYSLHQWVDEMKAAAVCSCANYTGSERNANGDKVCERCGKALSVAAPTGPTPADELARHGFEFKAWRDEGATWWVRVTSLPDADHETYNTSIGDTLDQALFKALAWWTDLDDDDDEAVPLPSKEQ